MSPTSLSGRCLRNHIMAVFANISQAMSAPSMDTPRSDTAIGLEMHVASVMPSNGSPISSRGPAHVISTLIVSTRSSPTAEGSSLPPEGSKALPPLDSLFLRDSRVQPLDDTSMRSEAGANRRPATPSDVSVKAAQPPRSPADASCVETHATPSNITVIPPRHQPAAVLFTEYDVIPSAQTSDPRDQTREPPVKATTRMGEFFTMISLSHRYLKGFRYRSTVIILTLHPVLLAKLTLIILV